MNRRNFVKNCAILAASLWILTPKAIDVTKVQDKSKCQRRAAKQFEEGISFPQTTPTPMPPGEGNLEDAPHSGTPTTEHKSGDIQAITKQESERVVSDLAAQVAVSDTKKSSIIRKLPGTAGK